MQAVSVVVTVKDEARSIGRLLGSISVQTRAPDEVVIADGGSRDETRDLIAAWGERQPFAVCLLRVPGANISQGRNAAIRASTGEVIAVTDAGVRLDERWLETLLEPLASDGRWAQPSTVHRPPSVVSGFFVPDPQTVFERAMAATVLPRLRDIRPQTFLPSSRSIAFTKAAWQAVGGYPEWLDYGEDLVFDFALRERFAFAFAPDARVYFRPRGSPSAFFRQYYLYARGDGKAGLWPWRHALRYFTYLVAAPLLLALGFRGSRLWWLLLGAGAAAYCRTPYRRLLPYLDGLNTRERLSALALVPLIRALGDSAKMLGYPAGVWWRRNRL